MGFFAVESVVVKTEIAEDYVLKGNEWAKSYYLQKKSRRK